MQGEAQVHEKFIGAAVRRAVVVAERVVGGGPRQSGEHRHRHATRHRGGVTSARVREQRTPTRTEQRCARWPRCRPTGESGSLPGGGGEEGGDRCAGPACHRPRWRPRGAAPGRLRPRCAPRERGARRTPPAARGDHSEGDQDPCRTEQRPPTLVTCADTNVRFVPVIRAGHSRGVELAPMQHQTVRSYRHQMGLDKRWDRDAPIDDNTQGDGLAVAVTFPRRGGGDDKADSADVSTKVTGDTGVGDDSRQLGQHPAATLTIRLVNENTQPGAEGEALDESLRLVDELSGGAMKVEILPTSRLPNEVWDQPARAGRAHTGCDRGRSGPCFRRQQLLGLRRRRDHAGHASAVHPLHRASCCDRRGRRISSPTCSPVSTVLVGVVGLEMFPAETFKVLVSFDGRVSHLRTSTGKVLQSRAAPELYRFFEGTRRGAASRTPSAARLYVGAALDPGRLGRGRRHRQPADLLRLLRPRCQRGVLHPGLSDDQRGRAHQRGGAGAGLRGRQPARGRVGGRACGVLPAWQRSRAPRRPALAEFEAAAASTIDGPEAELVVSELIARITATARARHRQSTRSAVLSRQASAGGPVPNGVYRFEITDDDLARSISPPINGLPTSASSP